MVIENKSDPPYLSILAVFSYLFVFCQFCRKLRIYIYQPHNLPLRVRTRKKKSRAMDLKVWLFILIAWAISIRAMAEHLVMNRNLGVAFSPAEVLLTGETVKVKAVLTYELGDIGAVLSSRCANKNITFLEMDRRVKQSQGIFNRVVNRKYPGFAYHYTDGTKASYERVRQQDATLREDQLLIQSRNDADVRARLSQCDREDTQCLIEPIIRSRRIGYINLNQETNFGLLACDPDEDGLMRDTRCHQLSPTSICCSVSERKSACGLNEALVPARSLVRNWISENPRARVLWRASPQSKVTKINPARMAYCYSITMASQRRNGQLEGRHFSHPIIEDKGRQWSSMYSIDNNEESLDEEDSDLLTNLLWDALSEPALPGGIDLPSLNLPSRKSKGKPSLKAEGKITAESRATGNKGTVALATQTRHTDFRNKYMTSVLISLLKLFTPYLVR